jgi:hypothetical protein
MTLSVSRLYEYSVNDRMIDEYEPFDSTKIGRGSRSTRRKPVPVTLYPAKLPHDLNWDLTRGEKLATNCLSYDTTRSQYHPYKGKAILATCRAGPQGCETSRLSQFLDNRSQMAVRLSALCAGRPLPRGRFLVFIPVRGSVDPRVT